MRITLPLFLVFALSHRLMAEFAVEEKPDRIVVSDAGNPVATYVFRDEKIRRPYWTAVHMPGGRLGTRRHPPVEGKDAVDHATMHPGIWLAFGDVGGEDFWRNRGLVRHERFAERIRATPDEVRFVVDNAYVAAAAGKEPLARETCRYRLVRRPDAYLLTLDSTIAATGGALVFGDQEEMGLGVRVATELTVRNGGTISNSGGGKNEKGTWGKAADWCDYSATIGNRRAGIAILAHPRNFAPCRFHSRDYGLLVANPFAVEAFGAGAKARTHVTGDEPLRLRFGILLYEGNAPPDLAGEYESFARDTGGD